MAMSRPWIPNALGPPAAPGMTWISAGCRPASRIRARARAPARSVRAGSGTRMATMKHPSVRNKSSYCLRINGGCQRGRSSSEGDVATMGIPAAPDEALEVVMQETQRQYQDTDQNVMLVGGQQVGNAH